MFTTAIGDGDVCSTKDLLSRGIDPNQLLGNGNTPQAYLHHVRRQGSLDKEKVSHIRTAIETNEISRVYPDAVFSYSIKDDTILRGQLRRQNL